MRRIALLIVPLASLMVGLPIRAADSLFPVDPAVNTQRGFAVALDGVWLAVGAPQEEEEEEQAELEEQAEQAKEEAQQDETRNAGAVRLYRLEAGVWIEKQRLASPEPKANGRFGHSVALSGLSLAVGAAGEGKVYVYTRDGEEWFRQEIVEAEGERFGQSVALDGERLAIGAVGSVHLLEEFGSEILTLKGDPAAPEERFGHSVSLRNGILAVGAPGAEESKGAVYVFQAGEEGWSRVARRTAADGGAGDQLGFAVAVGTYGNEVAAGAPDSDAPGAVNQGALYVFEKGAGWSDGADGRLAVPGIDGGDHLGHSVSIDGSLLAVGAPFGSSVSSGAVHILIRGEFSWDPVNPIEAGTAGFFDLFGYSVAVDGGRVAVGTLLLDQGGSSAGSAHTFTCNVIGCTAEGEAAASDQQPEGLFGISLDLDGDTLVATETLGHLGVVYVYRRAGDGWRQEARLASPSNAIDFGFAVAVRGDTLVVGAPFSGAAYLFRRVGEEWIPRATLTSPAPKPGDLFGLSVAIDSETVVIGAPGAGAAYVFEHGAAPGIPLLPPSALDGYGKSVAVSGDTIAVGAPSGLTPSVHLFQRTVRWAWKSKLSAGLPGSAFGWALSMDRGSLLVGAPYYVGAPDDEEASGAAFLYEQGSSEWTHRQTLSGSGLQFFGTALDFHDDAAIIVGYQRSSLENETDLRDVKARLYSWTGEHGLTAQSEVDINSKSLLFVTSFAAASRTLFAVGVPKFGPGDRVLILERNAPREVQP